MSETETIWLKAGVRESSIRDILINKGWVVQAEHQRSRFRERVLVFCQNEIHITYRSLHELGVHRLSLLQKNNGKSDNKLSAIINYLKSVLDTWELDEVYQNLKSDDLFIKIEALRILVTRSNVEKSRDAEMFSVLTQFGQDKNRILRIAANELCYYLQDCYADEIENLAQQRMVDDPELAENWKYLVRETA